MSRWLTASSRWLVLPALLGASACGSLLGFDDVSFDEPKGTGGTNVGGAGGGGGSGATPSGGGTAGAPSGGTSAGGTSAGGTSAGGTSAGGTGAGGTSAGGTSAGGTGGSTTDPYAAARQACVDHINELRATKSLPPYQRWTSAEACVDLQATDDEQNNSPHGAWKSKKFPCNGYGSGQNECLGGGAAGIVGCLDMMWAEKDQPGCAGCDTCTNPGGCADCDFYGTTTGDVCGHYVNMRSTGFSQAACGFSSLGGWAAINFQ